MRRFAILTFLAFLCVLPDVSAAQSSVTTGLTRTKIGRTLYPLDAQEIACSITAAQITPYYEYGDLRRYGGTTSGNNVTAFNRALCASVGRVLLVPDGSWRLDSKPNDLPVGVTIAGENNDQSILQANYTEGSATTGFLEIEGGGGQIIRDLRIHKIGTATGGAGIAVLSTAGANSSFIKIDNVIVTTENSGVATWNYAIYVDGTPKTSAPVGVRDLTITASQFFAATTDVASFLGVQNAYIEAGFFSSGGTATVVRFSGTASVPSGSVMCNCPFIDDLTLDRVNQLHVSASTVIDISDTSNVTNAVITAGGIATDTRNRSTTLDLTVTRANFLATLTGMTAGTTGTVEYTVTGSLVTLWAGSAITGTSNTTAMTMTGMPATLRPKTARAAVPCAAQDNGVSPAVAACSIATDGTITFLLSNVSGTKVNYLSTGFTNSGAKGVGAGWTLVYDRS